MKATILDTLGYLSFQVLHEDERGEQRELGLRQRTALLHRRREVRLSGLFQLTSLWIGRTGLRVDLAKAEFPHPVYYIVVSLENLFCS